MRKSSARGGHLIIEQERKRDIPCIVQDRAINDALSSGSTVRLRVDQKRRSDKPAHTDAGKLNYNLMALSTVRFIYNPYHKICLQDLTKKNKVVQTNQ